MRCFGSFHLTADILDSKHSSFLKQLRYDNSYAGQHLMHVFNMNHGYLPLPLRSVLLLKRLPKDSQFSSQVPIVVGMKGLKGASIYSFCFSNVKKGYESQSSAR